MSCAIGVSDWEPCSEDLLRLRIREPDPMLRTRQIQQWVTILKAQKLWLDIVPGIEDLMVRFDILEISTEDALACLQQIQLPSESSRSAPKRQLEIPVCYDAEFGLDLQDIASRTGLTTDEIIQRHTQTECFVSLIGFLPGFAYCDGADPALHVERLASPRECVPAGAIGIARGQVGIYALASPGGWPLLGRTPLQLLHPGADKSFLLEAGMTLTFRQITLREFHEMHEEQHG